MKAAICCVLSTVSTLVFAIDNDFDNLLQNVDQVHAPTDVYDGVAIIVKDLMTRELSISNDLRSSPQCWSASIAAVNRFNNHYAKSHVTSGSAYCAAMTENQLDILALELTSCEFIKARREMFLVDQSSDDSISITSDAISACPLGGYNPSQPYQASACLELLTDHAHAIYHQIRLHTKNLCRDIADEIFQRQREASTEMILRASTTLAHQIQAVLEGTSTAIEQLNMQTSLLQTQSHLIKENQREIERIQDVRKREEISQSLRIKQQLERMFEARKMEEAEADRLRKLREEGSLSLLQQQTHLMEQQQEKFEETYKIREEMMEQRMKERMMELEQMQKMITITNAQIKPLSTIESYVKFATDGFSVFNTILNLFISMNVVWIFSSMLFVNEVKRRLFVVIIFGFFLELAAIFYSESELLVGLGKTDMVGMIRYWTRVCCIATLCISCLVSCFLPSSADTGQNAPTMDDLLRSHLDFVSKLNAAQIESRVGTESKARAREKHIDTRIRSVRKFIPVSKSRKSSSPQQRFSTRAAMRAVTPYDDSRASVEVKQSNAKTEQARPSSTMDYLKEMQRDHTETDSNYEFASSNSEPSSASRKSAQDNRKRKFSDIWDDSKDEVMLHDSQHDHESVSSMSTGSSSSRTNARSQKRQR